MSHKSCYSFQLCRGFIFHCAVDSINHDIGLALTNITTAIIKCSYHLTTSVLLAEQRILHHINIHYRFIFSEDFESSQLFIIEH